MKFIASLALLLSVVGANPIKREDEPKKFNLKTSGASHPEHNNLYVYGYHTAAGQNDAVLTPDVKTASPAFMNGSHVQFALDTPFPWGLVMHLSNNYAAWEPVMIDAGYGQDEFSVDGTGLQWSKEQGFGGWLVCDWYHNEPQLFYLDAFRKHVLPEECSEIQLQLEYLS
ncbi:hypothetical protein BDV59DRAFT_185653 [Aspergillus ambiguus]|uniref:uncharacterized protein n=1 Tax=Aspergillus ambiguus TaxID=176160 RepID=UPI003CCD4C87